MAGIYDTFINGWSEGGIFAFVKIEFESTATATKLMVG
jgi:hypothetical protein